MVDKSSGEAWGGNGGSELSGACEPCIEVEKMTALAYDGGLLTEEYLPSMLRKARGFVGSHGEWRRSTICGR